MICTRDPQPITSMVNYFAYQTNFKFYVQLHTKSLLTKYWYRETVFLVGNKKPWNITDTSNKFNAFNLKIRSDFLTASHSKSSSRDNVGRKQVDSLLERSLAKSLPAKDSFLSKTSQQLFFNTILPFHPLPLLSACFHLAKICRKPNVLVLVTSTLKC